MRKLLKSILAAFARLMRRLLGLPEPVIEEEYEDVPDALSEAEVKRSDEDEDACLPNRVSRTLADRLREAASYRLQGLPWGVLLGPGELHEREWLEARTDSELRRIASIDRDLLERHLTGQAPIRGIAPLVRRPFTTAELREMQRYTDIEPSSDPGISDDEYARLRREREAEKRGGGKSGGSKGPAKAAQDDVSDILTEVYEMINAKAA